MGNFFKTFFRHSDQETARLATAADNEITDMARLVTSAHEHGIITMPHMTDDAKTAVQAAVMATEALANDPQYAARMAWVSPDLR